MAGQKVRKGKGGKKAARSMRNKASGKYARQRARTEAKKAAAGASA